MKKALIIRYGAFGDVIHCSHLPRLLKQVEEYDYVAVETNAKGLQIFGENPHIDKLMVFEPSHASVAGRPYSYLERHWAIISEGFDKVINLQNSIEYGYIAMEDQNIYYQNNEVRRKAFGDVNYYDICLKVAGIEGLDGTKGEIHYKDSEIKFATDFIRKYDGRFVVLVNLSGSSLHKRFISAEEVCEAICKKYPNALIITTGDADCKVFDFTIGDSISMVGKHGFRALALLSSFVDLVIGCESGLLVAANMWGTPAIQLLTAANKNNHPKYADNDYSLQSPALCSPCHKGPYKYIGCPIKDGYPVCVYFDPTKILEQVDKAYHDCYAKSVA